MASIARLVIALIASCIAVEGLRFDPPNLRTGGKYFSSGLRLTPNDPRCKENGIFANPDDCTSYYVCKDGASQDRHCPEGFKFDSFKHCTLDEDADCGKPTPPQSPSDSDVVCPDDYGYFPYRSDCHKYVTCTDGKPKIEICPDSQYYLNYVGCIDGRVCPQNADADPFCKHPNGRYPLRGECRKYVQCISGKPHLKECPLDQGFDLKMLRCIKLDKKPCRSNDVHDILQ